MSRKSLDEHRSIDRSGVDPGKRVGISHRLSAILLGFCSNALLMSITPTVLFGDDSDEDRGLDDGMAGWETTGAPSTAR